MSMSRNIVRDMFTSQGTVTLNGTTAVVVNPTIELNPGAQILLTTNTPAGTQTGNAYVSARTNGQPGTCTFSVKGTGAADTSTVNYTIIG